MRRVFQRPAVWDEGVGLVQKMGGDGVGGCRWLAVVSREKRSRERWCGALLSASLDLPKLGSGQRGRKPSVPPTLFCRCLSCPREYSQRRYESWWALSAAILMSHPTAVLNLQTAFTQPSGGAFPRLLKTHMISIASRADGLSGWPHIYAACTPFYIGSLASPKSRPCLSDPEKAMHDVLAARPC